MAVSPQLIVLAPELLEEGLEVERDGLGLGVADPGPFLPGAVNPLQGRVRAAEVPVGDGPERVAVRWPAS